MKPLSERMLKGILRGTAEDYMNVGEWAGEVVNLEQQVNAVKVHAETCGFVCICCPLEITPGTFLGPDGNWYCEEHFKEIITEEQPNA